MAARTGKEYIAGLRDERVVWLGNEKVNVLEHPELRGSIQGMAGYFNWQHRYANDCLVTDPETGEKMSASLIVPRNATTSRDAMHASNGSRVIRKECLDVHPTTST